MRRTRRRRSRGDSEAAAEPAAARDNTLFFISYSRTTDLAPRAQLHQALISTGRGGEPRSGSTAQTLEPGDDYTQRILDGIRNSRYFLPLVSRAATERERAFVFREWSEATSQCPEMNRTYLVPLVVDADYQPESYREASVATWLERKINFGHAPEGNPTSARGRSLTSLLREARSRA